MNEQLIPNARLYAVRYQLEVAELLGSGKDGIVFISRRKDKAGQGAIKVLKEVEAYHREKLAYLRLTQASIRMVLGFNVPQFLGCDDELRVIEMTIVQRPFVLDFAAAYLNSRPEFPAEVWEDWE